MSVLYVDGLALLAEWPKAWQLTAYSLLCHTCSLYEGEKVMINEFSDNLLIPIFYQRYQEDRWLRNAGTRDGLRLTLYNEQDDYAVPTTTSAGFRVG